MDNFENSFRYAELIIKDLKDGLSVAEKQMLKAWLTEDVAHQQLFDQLSKEHFVAAELELYISFDKDEVRNRLLAQVTKKPKTVKLWPRIAAAVAAVAIAIYGIWFFTTSRPDLKQYTNIQAGTNKATLTLASGETIDLSSAKSGVIIGATNLTYDDGTSLDSSLRGRRPKQSTPQDWIASARTAPTNDGLTHDGLKRNDVLLTTPRGGTYQAVLPDGTRVWLNAASSIQFPLSFTGKERLVKLSGEGYFIVKHNAKQTFRVITKGQVVEDIGTEFNINAYSDEVNVKTTLIEGSARVSSLRNAPRKDGLTRNAVLLVPGQQSTLKGETLQVKQIDPTEAIAWKKGFFQFDNADLQTVMRQIARWYNLEVSYEGQIPPGTFDGKVYRNLPLSKVLEALQGYKLNFRMEGRRILIKGD